METILSLYQEPYDETRPVVCFDESSKELRKHVRGPLPAIMNEITPENMNSAKEEYNRDTGGRSDPCSQIFPRALHRERLLASITTMNATGRECYTWLLNP
jgi:hypothetical protein